MANHRPTTADSPAVRAHRRRRRSLAAVVAGTTLGAMLSVASGLTGVLPGLGAGASAAASVLRGVVYRDTNGNGAQDPPTGFPALDENNVAGVTVTAYTATGSTAGSAATAVDGTWSITTSAEGPFRVEFTNYPSPYTSGNAAGGTSVQFPASTNGPINFSLLAKVNGLGAIEHITDMPVEIGDRVWKDTNGNGVQDPGEPGIAGVQIRLIQNATVQATKTTDANGLYSFGSLFLHGSYCLEIDPGQASLVGLDITKRYARDVASSSALNDSNGQLVDTVISECLTTGGPGENDHTYDFGFVVKPVTTTTTTIAPTTTTIAETTTTTVAPTSTTVAPTTTTTTVPAGRVSIGDVVWLDLNANGIQDPNEGLIRGVPVELYRDGALIASTTTDTTGHYLFTGLEPGTYQVKFITNVNFMLTQKGAGSNRAVDSNAGPDGLTDPVTVPSGSDLTIDAGFVTGPTRACLGNFVWLDSIANGVQDAGELGIANVLVRLYTATGDLAQSTLTNSFGEYLFCGLVPGTYSVVFTPPSGTSFTSPLQGSDQTIDSDADPVTGRTGSVTLVGGEFNRTIDAGIVATSTTTTTTPTTTTTTTTPTTTTTTPTTTTTSANTTTTTTPSPKGCIGDFVWRDTNANGVQDSGELGVPNVLVTLRRYVDSGVSAISIRTDANGAYLFCDLAPGAYSVLFSELPSGTAFTRSGQGTDRTKDSDVDVTSGSTAIVTLLAGETNRNLDAGLISVLTTTTTSTTTTTTTTPAATVCVGDYVWADTNGNGVQDAGEAGIGGVRATIYRADGTEVLYTLSNSAGAWQICGIAPGSYFVRFTGLPVNTTFTTPRVGGNPATDSDPDASGTTPVFAVGTVNVLTIDAGIIATTTPLVIVLPNVPLPTTTIPPTTTTLPSGCLGDKIFRDPGNAKDGTGISGVTIVLGRSDHSTLTTVTDGNGNYSFCLLPPGTYTVTVHPPAGSANTYDIDGNKDNKVSALLRTGESNLDLDFGYSTINVGPEVITQTTLAPAAPSTPIESPPLSYTGARSTLLALWALTFLLVGYGIFGLTPARRRRSLVV